MFRIPLVLAFVLVLSGTTAAQQALSPADLTPAEKSGRTLFQTKCAMCHVGQEPGTETRDDNAPQARPTLGPVLSQRHANDEAGLREKIQLGSERMPGYRYTLTDEQIDHVIAFMKTIDGPLTRLAVARPGE